MERQTDSLRLTRRGLRKQRDPTKGGKPRRTECVATREKRSGKYTGEKGNPIRRGTDDVYRPLEPLRQHVLLDYRLKLPDPEGSSTVFSCRNVVCHAFVVHRAIHEKSNAE